MAQTPPSIDSWAFNMQPLLSITFPVPGIVQQCWGYRDGGATLCPRTQECDTGV